MAQIYGQPGDEPGDQLVYKALGSLPEDYLIYAQKKLVHGSEERNPDYVILNLELGVIILEVKDWIKVDNRDEKKAWVYRSKTGKVEEETSPVEQARKAAFILVDKLLDCPDLRNYAGRLDFPYRYAGALPHLPMATISWLEQAWGVDKLLGYDDLVPEKIRGKIRRIPAPFDAPMSQRQFDAVRAVLDPLNLAVDVRTGQFKGIYDPQQEAIAKEPLKTVPGDGSDHQPESNVGQGGTKQVTFLGGLSPSDSERLGHLEETAPNEVKELMDTTFVRLVRGFAGTGKTDVLVLRAHYIHQQYPEKKLLVTTFNRPLMEERLKPELKEIADVHTFDELCSQIYQKRHGAWVPPQSTEGIVARLAPDHRYIKELGQQFVAEEIIWMKENSLVEREKYMDTHREGRAGMSRSLTRKEKNAFFDVFEAYQSELKEISPHDWADLHEKVLKYLRSGTEPEKIYDIVLVDEAQHFAPTWMQALRFFMRPDGALFLCDDPSQSVYRLFSWRQRGVEVVGRTRWLRLPYRNTRQIFEAAYTLIDSNPLAQKMLEEGDEPTLPDLDNDFLRSGELPHVHRFNSAAEERMFLLDKISQFIHSGILPAEIAVLHTQKYVLSGYRDILPKGVQVDDLRRRTGMEYPAVVIPQVQELFDRDPQVEWQEDQARQQLILYMAMTRARDQLYLLYEQKWPKSFDPIKPMVIWHNH